MLGVSDIKKLINDIAPKGQYLIVDFSGNLPQFHFGRKVTPRNALQLNRCKKMYGVHVRNAGLDPSNTRSSAAADARRQIKEQEEFKAPEVKPVEPEQIKPEAKPDPVVKPQAKKKVAKKKTAKKK